MRRNKARKRGRQRQHRIIAVLLAVGGAYVLASTHMTALRVTEPSAAEAIAARFPELAAADAASARTLIAAAAPHAPASNDAALLNPQPMTPQALLSQTMMSVVALPQSAPSRAAPDLQAPIKLASADMSALPRAAAPRPAGEIKTNSHRASADRPGYLLNDTQIAEIKTRLNLTPDQEDMWPAVEAALRNMRGQPLRTRTLAAAPAQTAAVDPDSVQGLKSAAVPLILSFSGEQKDEVRAIIHAMGLDQLASQF